MANRYTGPAMTLANMRENGVTSIVALCECDHEAIVDASELYGALEVPASVLDCAAQRADVGLSTFARTGPSTELSGRTDRKCWVAPMTTGRRHQIGRCRKRRAPLYAVAVGLVLLILTVGTFSRYDFRPRSNEKRGLNLRSVGKCVGCLSLRTRNDLN